MQPYGSGDDLAKMEKGGLALPCWKATGDSIPINAVFLLTAVCTVSKCSLWEPASTDDKRLNTDQIAGFTKPPHMARVPRVQERELDRTAWGYPVVGSDSKYIRLPPLANAPNTSFSSPSATRAHYRCLSCCEL